MTTFHFNIVDIDAYQGVVRRLRRVARSDRAALESLVGESEQALGNRRTSKWLEPSIRSEWRAALTEARKRAGKSAARRIAEPCIALLAMPQFQYEAMDSRGRVRAVSPNYFAAGEENADVYRVLAAVARWFADLIGPGFAERATEYHVRTVMFILQRDEIEKLVAAMPAMYAPQEKESVRRMDATADDYVAREIRRVESAAEAAHGSAGLEIVRSALRQVFGSPTRTSRAPSADYLARVRHLDRLVETAMNDENLSIAISEQSEFAD